jgi:DMSO/TMAO reductase YedYZ molybdopterin-dependent catalytic subunit
MRDQTDRSRAGGGRAPWYGWLAGAIAMLGMLAVLILGRSITGTVSLVDALADAMLLAMPLSVFSWLLDLLGQQAKTFLLVGLLLLLILVGAWLGGRFVRKTIGEPASIWPQASKQAILLFGFAAGFVLLFVNTQSPKVFSGGGFISTAIVLGLASVVFALILAGLTLLFLRSRSGLESRGRRGAIIWGGVAVASLLGLIPVGREISRVAGRKTNLEVSRGEMPPAITPIEDFYTISKNFVDPPNDRGPEWSIEVNGLVDQDLTLGQADLEALGRGDFISTMLCISNTVGGGLIGTADWTGVSLRTVLEQAGIGDGAVKVIFEGTDGYTTGVPIERVMQPESHLVWEMNGQPLPREHGAPVRAIVPGLYGMKSVKWLTKMTVTEDDYQGYWEQRNWTDEAVVKTMSRIDLPINNEVLPAGPVKIGGIAFAGARGVDAVEVSTDDGESWERAEIQARPNPDGIAWVLWSHEWSARPGAYTLVVRAIDGTGEVQTSEEVSELPDGSSGWHRITVGVV